MDILMTFVDIIREFGEKIGIDALTFDDEGSVTLLFDGEHEITFTPDADDHSVLFHAEMGSASHMDSNSYMKLLTASLLGAETGGAAFAIHEALGNIILWKRHDDVFNDCADFERAVTAFLGQVIAWKDKLNDIDSTNTQTTEAFEPTQLAYQGIMV